MHRHPGVAAVLGVRAGRHQPGEAGAVPARTKRCDLGGRDDKHGSDADRRAWRVGCWADCSDGDAVGRHGACWRARARGQGPSGRG